MGKCCLSDLRDVFSHAVNLRDFACCELENFEHEGDQYAGLKFPPNMRISIYSIGQIVLPFVLPFSNQLRELNLRHLNKANQCFLIRRCPNLEALYANDVFGDYVLQVIGESCKKLRRLKTDGSATTHMAVTDMGLIALAQGCLELECLHINFSKKKNSKESLECIGCCLKNLNDFKITLHYSTTSVLDSGIRAMLIGCSKLEWLRINHHGGPLTDASLGYIGNYGHNLRHLSVGGYIRYFEEGLVELSKGCPRLRKLENCDKLTTLCLSLYLDGYDGGKL